MAARKRRFCARSHWFDGKKYVRNEPASLNDTKRDKIHFEEFRARTSWWYRKRSMIAASDTRKRALFIIVSRG